MGAPGGERGIVICDDTTKNKFRGLGFRILRSAEIDEVDDSAFQVVLSIENVTGRETPTGKSQQWRASLLVRVEAPERDRWPTDLTDLDGFPEALEPEDAVEEVLGVVSRRIRAFSEGPRDFGDDADPVIDLLPEDADTKDELGDLDDQSVSMEERWELWFQDDPATS